MDLDDDSDNDSDYVPEDELEKNDKKTAKITEDIASNKRKRKINAVWEEIKLEEQQYVKDKLFSLVNNTVEVMIERPSKRMRLKLARFLKNFSRPSLGASIPEKERVETKNDIKDRLRAALPNLKRKTVVTESRKFAGEAVLVHKTVSITKEEEKMPQNEGGIDKLLQTLKGPKQINTVSKSAMDWDNYKEKEGISDEIAAVSKDGYLGKQDFLQSCDVRRFEIEKEQRILNRDKQK